MDFIPNRALACGVAGHPPSTSRRAEECPGGGVTIPPPHWTVLENDAYRIVANHALGNELLLERFPAGLKCRYVYSTALQHPNVFFNWTRFTLYTIIYVWNALFYYLFSFCSRLCY